MRKETLSAAVVGSLVTLLVASGLAVSAGAEQPGDGARRGYNRLQLTPTPTPTATLGPSGSVVRARRGAPPNALVGLSAVGGGLGGSVCDEIPNGTSAFHAGKSPDTGEYTDLPIASGETVPMHSLADVWFGWEVTGDDFPAICSTTPIPESGAFAESPTRERSTPIVENGTDASSVQLPLEAFMQPGLWHLVLTQPAFYEIWVEIPRPDAPFYLTDGNLNLIGGFAPLERVKGVILDGDYADFDLQVDENGYTLFELDWDSGYLFWIGEYGNFVGTQPLLVPTSNPYDAWYSMSEYEAGRLLYDTFWGGAPNSISPQAEIAASAANLRSGPGLGFEVVGWGRSGERYPAIGRAYGDDRVWYKIRLADRTAAWISERIVVVVPSADSIPWVDEYSW